MPRYHYNIYDGHSSPDMEGTDLPNWQMAQYEAVRLAGAVIADKADRILRGEDWRMEVTDHTGLILFRLDFSFQRSAAVTGEAHVAG